MNGELLLFGCIAGGMIVTGLAVILARNVVHAVLAMIVHFVLTAVAYLLLGAPLIAMAQVAVYAGAIMVLFLFVVMLMGGGRATLVEPMPALRLLGIPAAILAGALLSLGAIGRTTGRAPVTSSAMAASIGSPAAIGEVLFRDYVVAFELVGVLLLVAVIGAVAIAVDQRVPGPLDAPDVAARPAPDEAANEVPGT